MSKPIDIPSSITQRLHTCSASAHRKQNLKNYLDQLVSFHHYPWTSVWRIPNCRFQDLPTKSPAQCGSERYNVLNYRRQRTCMSTYGRIKLVCTKPNAEQDRTNVSSVTGHAAGGSSDLERRSRYCVCHGVCIARYTCELDRQLISVAAKPTAPDHHRFASSGVQGCPSSHRTQSPLSHVTLCEEGPVAARLKLLTTNNSSYILLSPQK